MKRRQSYWQNWQKYQEILEEKCKNWIPSEKIGKEDERLTEVLLQAAHASIPFGNGGKSRLPFWNEDCTEAVKERDEAQERATAPRHSTEDVTAYVQLKKKAQQTINKAKAAFIREKTMRLGASCDL